MRAVLRDLHMYLDMCVMERKMVGQLRQICVINEAGLSQVEMLSLSVTQHKRMITE